jgi:prepilin-type N-terminal cleavage/methylation domain-containing protein
MALFHKTRFFRRTQGIRGLTLLEVSVTAAILGLLVTGVFSGMLNSQRAFLEDQTVSDLSIRAQNTMDRIVRLAGQALTTDDQFSPLKPNTGVQSHCLRFRVLQTVDPLTGDPVYDDAARVFLYGPDEGANPSSGVIVGRGPDLNQIHATGAGPDAVLGTVDDDTTTILAGGVSAVEVLLSDTFSPRLGDMFTINVAPAPIGRLLTVTLRVNVRRSDGTFLLANDLVISERVALRE